MYLKSIKLAGFKSFADPTTIYLPGSLTAIVGPNGCGKSNIVDALRWVIGESSAKQLRGEHLADVIFNGSSNRKPVGQAAIELSFDNSQGRLGGEYAQYHEIAIRREITREGQSQFYFNGKRCRRRDITDLFLGTGLGPNSYAVIEQGIISKLVEGKPEDIRTYLEEAAGTSKYRERRRETENRLQHTRENLARLTDIRLEMEKQLEHLKRQASSAERYKILKQDQRLTKAQLHALQCNALDQQLAEQQSLLDQQTVQLEEKTVAHTQVVATIEQHRVLQAQTNDDYNAVQARYYQVGGEVAQQEQRIQHVTAQNHQLAEDLAQMQKAWEEAEQHLLEDRTQIASLNNMLAVTEPEAQQALHNAQRSSIALQAIEKKRSECQLEWERFITATHQAQHQADITQTRFHQVSQKIANFKERIAHLEQQSTHLNTTELEEEISALSQQSTALKQELETFQHKLTALNQQIQQQQQNNRELQSTREQQLKALNALFNQQASLTALQQAAMGKRNQGAVKWLEKLGWTEKPRLLEGLVVEKGWEIAVETVLAPYLEAVCTENLDDFQTVAEQFREGRLVMFCTHLSIPEGEKEKSSEVSLSPLTTKIQSCWPITTLLDNIYIAEDINTALTHRASLAAHESIITPTGFWFGPTWLRISHIQDETRGVLERQQALQTLETSIAEQQQAVQLKEQAYQEGLLVLSELERERDQQQQASRALSVQQSALQARLTAQQSHLAKLQHQENTIAQEREKLKQQQTVAETELESAQLACEQAQTEKQQLEINRPEKLAQKQALETEFQQQRQQAEADKKTADTSQKQLSTTQNQLYYLTQNIQRAEKQLAQLQERREALLTRQSTTQTPLSELESTLQNLLDKQTVVEENLQLEKQKLAALEEKWRHYEKQRTQLEKEIQHLRDGLEKIRIIKTTAQTQRENHLIPIGEAGYLLETLLQEMPKEASVPAWQEALERIENRLQRLGAVNLTAIEEYQNLLERKNYLDSQDKDLCGALETLEEAIRKIDRESRARLRETFDQANTQFKTLFTNMFAGGHAELEWVGDEILSAGVVIRAQPPGKRNTLLHLLSGGEKALTAIALVFALFQLNPAPFCVLDEVDAPLDEANVGRFCRLVKSMSATVQFLFISHNKTTMSMAEQMIGITMQEPGVSRLVSVDMEQAAMSV